MVTEHMFGYTSKSLLVDLSKKKTEIIETPGEFQEKFIGGRGTGVALVGKRIRNDFDSPDMPLVFASGPLVGTASPTSGRSSVISRSPLTGTIFDCSVGGRFGTEIKRAGFDFIEIVGISDDWVLIDILDKAVKIEKAEKLQGKNVPEVRDMLGRAGSEAVIGIAGERGVSFASIVVDGHYVAGRGGLGAVMGSKRLKAIRVSGSSPVGVYDSTALRVAREDIMRLLRASQAVFGELGLSEYGTAALVDLIHARRLEPTDNFRKTFFPGASVYSGYNLRKRYLTKKTGCRGCPVLCKKRGKNGEVMPEYETVSHFGALNDNSDIGSIVEANRLCNEFGLDTISTAATISCFAEIEGKRIPPEEILDLVRKIGLKADGRAAQLSEGSARLAAKLGRPELSMTVKGLELPAYDPRGAYGMALAYATSNRGGCHLRAYPVSHEVLRKPVVTDRFTFEGKARIIKIAEDMNAVVDSLTSCKFVFFAATLEEYARVVSAVTGRYHDTQTLLKAGERIYLYERYLNSLNGFGIDDDDLPGRFFDDEGTSSEHIEIKPLDREEFLGARGNYYKIRGYGQDGIPERDVLIGAGLKDYL